MSDAVPDPEAQLRSLQRRLRRDKLALEKVNPLEHPEAYAAALEQVLDLEVERRDLRALVRDVDEPVVVTDDTDDDTDDTDDADESDDDVTDDDAPSAAP